jgi:glycosyltransferase involved in cell wall biosynthesis
MKVGLLICTYNRSNYLRDCLWSLERAYLSRVDTIIFSDDSSSDQETITLLKEFQKKRLRKNLPIFLNLSSDNKGIKNSLLFGYEEFFNHGFDLVINLDSDAVVQPDFVNQLLDNYFCGIITGFHSTTRNANGTERHKILYEESGLYVKQSVGGINFCINKDAYGKYVKPALLQPVGNWDHQSCINAGYAYCLKESVIQHIGFDSSMNHTEQPDVADDFYYWDLPDVTLIGVDNDMSRLERARDICTKWIRFGSVKLLNPGLTSKEQYSEWCIRELYKHVDTSHMLVFQHDGYVHNWKAWDNDWLQYDYIGAPWYYTDGYDVGNGGFSLRSRALMEAVSQIAEFTHPEDHHICRTYRPQLEAMGFKFAPLEVAERFSFEGYMQPDKHLTNQFGKHGQRANTKFLTGNVVFNQAAGLGDILFLIPMARAIQNEGRHVIWPIADEYFSIAKHFPDIDFRRKSEVDINYDMVGVYESKYGRVLPYRFAIELTGRGMIDCMRMKYEMYGHDYKMWRGLYWKRDTKKEAELIELVGATGKYIVVNRGFGFMSKFQIQPKLPNTISVIEMSMIDGYSLIDWLGVLEGAKEIHTANTSILYLLELWGKDIPVYIYKRGLWGENSFEHTDYLWLNKNFKFEI